MNRFSLLLLLTCGAVGWAADVDVSASYEDRAAIVVSNDKIELTVLPLGGPLASIVLRDDAEKLNPLWDSFRNDRESGRPVRMTGGVGHFTCVDGFGPVSEEESAAGSQGHGEAHRLYWSTVSATASGGEAKLVQTVQLPRLHETFTREISLRDGENVLLVRSTLKSLLSFDRPAVWAEHATIGSPFLERGVTVVDMSANRAKTRPRENGGDRLLLASDVEFEWPMAPTKAGGKMDMRAPLKSGDQLDHTGHLMTPSGKHAWVTALHPEKGLLIGYVFPTADFPWLQTWQHYPEEGLMARGLEFGTQAFDLPRRTVIEENKLFGQLLYRWLPAMSEIKASYLMFWTRTPEGFEGVSDVRLEGGKLVIRDDRSGKSMELPTAQTL